MTDEYDGDWDACPHCGTPVPIDEDGGFVLHLKWWGGGEPFQAIRGRCSSPAVRSGDAVMASR